MPIQGPSSYIAVTQAFLANWGDVNTALGGNGPLTLAGQIVGSNVPVTLAGLTALYNALIAQRDTVTEALVNLDFARSEASTLRVELVARIAQFIGMIRGNLEGTKYARALPEQPDVQSTQETLRTAAVRAKTIWTRVNADAGTGLTLPLALQNGYEVGDFAEQIEDLAPRFSAVEEARGQVKLEREERNDLQDKIYPLLKAYRQVMPTKFPPTHALVATLPDLTPKAGSTPNAVTLTGTWSAPDSQAKLTWTASPEPTLDHYELRAVPGEEYDSEDEVSVASIAKDAPRELLTDKFLTQPGQHSSFKLYVVLTTGNEAGSEPVMITRP